MTVRRQVADRKPPVPEPDAVFRVVPGATGVGPPMRNGIRHPVETLSGRKSRDMRPQA